MYLPKHFEQPRIDVMHDLIRSHPLATLITMTAAGIEVNHIPLLLSDQPRPLGTLCGHVARANPLWRDYQKEVEVVAVFNGPESYISPTWYATKKQHGKVVPTWNYAVTHAYGTLRVMDDAVWLRTHLEQLTAHNEDGRPAPWMVDDAPREYTEKMIMAIVGIEIVITRLIGKWKVSQNQPAENRASVIHSLNNGSELHGTSMATLIADAGKNF
ncbi:FMN-binding negative transcriptional regulator [Glaciimonas immobilis]|uniref:Transcriptional regulator n=1 Tax=Glaciimonas immobilis TaxID=728004 RepID=A0A840RVI8_9BURK|nr:FMN-binding negative transcriptional regulator [Glaciimonas immobilis]KAF3997693.1 FMN-binding negative transcriptional regulator [Glaciimonas immobilis]MBB5200591.1 transcriptional regulator [Glaciimonas immobilis]